LRDSDVAYAIRLGAFYSQPRARLLDAPLDANHAAIKVNVLPTQCQNFTAPRTACQRKANNLI
jgi:hypothetical protein